MLFNNHPVHHARSAGTSDKARIRITQKLIEWATVIFVMERKHKEILMQRFPSSITEKQIIVLEIEDNYRFNDPELLEILRDSLIAYLQYDQTYLYIGFNKINKLLLLLKLSFCFFFFVNNSEFC
jgi:predicted protein tyrosine phosphatase